MVIPLCRCRVLYVGSAIPTVTKDGLQGIQQPLRERYPIDESHDTKGIDSWLSVWSNGLLLEYIDGERRSETAFFPITSLHYCAAVRYVNLGGYSVESGGGERFLPLDSPFASLPDSPHPPIFAGIFRRTTGVRVLECHAFICTNAKAANALVRCCFHAYADSIYLKMDDKIPGLKAIKEASRSSTPHSDHLQSADEENERDIIRWSEQAIGKQTWQRRQQSGDYDTASISSSLAARYRNNKEAQPPIDGAGTGTLKSTAGGALVPYANGAGGGIYHHHQRRSGSEVDLASATRQQHHHNYHHEGYPPPMGMFPHGPPPFMPPPFHPPMGMMPAGGPPPPPFAMMPPFGPPPPHMMIPPGMRMPPPPPPFFAGPPFLPPHPHHPMFGGMMPPPPFMGPPGRRGGPPPPPESSSGPIITGPESVYGTLPRNRSGAFEEPIYMPGAHNGAYPPQASYQPSTFPPDQYDAYYDSYRQQHHRSPHTKHKAPSSTSGGRAPESSHYWDAYESGIYRKPYINEKAFGAAMQSESVVLNSNTTNVNNTNGRTTTTTAEIVRPETPPVDYENGGGINGLHLSDTKGRTAVY